MVDRYLVFGGPSYYASGGSNDFIGSFNDFLEAVKFSQNVIGKKIIYRFPEEEDKDWDVGEYDTIEWSHVFDLQKKEIVHKNNDAYGYDTVPAGVE